jgi:hypothetical protein
VTQHSPPGGHVKLRQTVVAIVSAAGFA